MAKKGGAQQLQTEINSDEELIKFLERPGLIVMDVYSEWCGPCLAMVGSLRKIKLELGGDNLQLALCKADTIQVFERFRNKSEPTWLFATRGKLVNLMFGSDVPNLMKLIAKELTMLGTPRRQFYELFELQPEECARRDVIESALAEARRKEMEEATAKKLEYLTYVTDEIMNNLPDMGVTIFGPHVVRDTYKKLMEIAETHKMQCKDRRTSSILQEHFEVVNFFCENPIDPEILEHMLNKDLLIGFWKTNDESKDLADIFLAYAHELTAPRKVLSELGEEDQMLPPILAPLEIKIATQSEERPQKDEPPAEDAEEFIDPLTEILGEQPLPGEEIVEGEDGNELLSANQGTEGPSDATLVSSDAKILLVPPIWVPTDRRTHAALIYVFFRPQTTAFLPPDPIPDPPHVVMAFDAYKKKDIFEVIAKNQDYVLLYGFFSNDNPDTAKLIANTMTKYESKPPQTTDKLVLKVAKKTSHAMLAFASYGPTYVSTNTVIGKEEALKFFPEGYDNTEPEPEVEVEFAKKSKKSKAKEHVGEVEQTSAPAPEGAEETAGESNMPA